MQLLTAALKIARDLFADVWGFGGFQAWNPTFGWSFGTAFGALGALWLMLCTLLCALRITRWLLPEAPLPLRWSSTWSVGMWLATLGFHGLRGLHIFRLAYGLIGCTALWLLTRYALPGCPLLRREWRALRALCARFKYAPHVLVSAS